MTAVKSRPRFRCEFCRRVSAARTMKAHEVRCFLNPNRECELCHNTAWFPYGYCGKYGWLPCPYCLKAQEVLLCRINRMGESGQSGEPEFDLFDSLYGCLTEKLLTPPEVNVDKALDDGWRKPWGQTSFVSDYVRENRPREQGEVDEYDPFQDE